MKINFKLFVIAFLGLISCNKPQKSLDNELKIDLKTEAAKINDYLKKYEEPSQYFNVSTDKPSKIKGKLGTIIYLNPQDLLAEDGQALGNSVEVELKELLNQEQLLRADAPTTSNGQLLVSGGAYYINIKSNGQQLKLKDGKYLSVEFPKITSEEMFLFYGQRDTLGQLNWQQVDQKFENKPRQNVKNNTQEHPSLTNDFENILSYIELESNKPLTSEEQQRIEENAKIAKVLDYLYQPIKLNQFGWINCDRFYNVPNKTNLYYSFNPKDSIVSAKVYLVFKNINSIMQSFSFSIKDNEYKGVFDNIPVGENTKIIAFTIKNGKLYSYSSDLKIKTNQRVQIELKGISQDQTDKIFQLN